MLEKMNKKASCIQNYLESFVLEAAVKIQCIGFVP